MSELMDLMEMDSWVIDHRVHHAVISRHHDVGRSRTWIIT